jgi:hypothetical protein
MLPKFLTYPDEYVPDVYQVRVRARYDTGEYWVRHVVYLIILFGLTSQARSPI